VDKLIITIIGIALSAATLIWSTDYITSLYVNAQSAARAQKWITEAAQITTAARQSGTLSLSTDNWQQGTAAALVPTYLSGLPQHNGNYVFQPCNVQSNATVCPIYVTDTTHAADATLIEATVENAAVCNAIQKIANPHATTPPSATVSGSGPITISYALAVNGNQQFACVNVSGVYYFLYRVFMDR
jgi:hypothetical protein